jgi:hypothetical protein
MSLCSIPQNETYLIFLADEWLSSKNPGSLPTPPQREAEAWEVFT